MRIPTSKARYFLWALANVRNSDWRCPSCGVAAARLVRRKAVVTALVECRNCQLRFRVPKETAQAASEFYQSEYHSGFTTECPSDGDLSKLLAAKFKSTEKDYRTYIEILVAAGLQPGDTILDFGCSWGYGSWQLQDAGFQVVSYDVSAPRVRFAAEKLNCNVITNIENYSGPVRCFFSAHVMEHLPDPNAIWKAASRILADGGVFVCFAPNGNPMRERTSPDTYHKLWGKTHPLMWTSEALRESSRRHGFTPSVFSSPYSLDNVRLSRDDEFVDGDEILLIATCRTPKQIESVDAPK